MRRVNGATSKEVRWKILLIVSMVSFITPFMGSSVSIAVPQIGMEFHATAFMLGWVLAIYLVTSAMFLLPAGSIADLYGRRMMFRAGIVLFSLSSLLCAISPSLWFLLGMRAFQGVASAMLFSTAIPILISTYPLNMRGKVLGINVASVYTGLSAGPFLGGTLTETFGWRSIFILSLSLSLVALFIAHRSLNIVPETIVPEGIHEDKAGDIEKPPRTLPHIDSAGSLIYMIAIAMGVYGLTSIGNTSHTFLLLSGSLLLLAVFVKIELSTPHPLINLRTLLPNIPFTLSNIAAMVNYTATFGVVFMLAVYLQLVIGIGPANTGIILLTQPLVQTLLSPIAGNLSDHIEPRVVASIGMGICSIALFALSGIGPDTSVSIIMVLLAILGFGFALFSSPNTNAVMSSVEPSDFSTASAVLGTMRSLGQSLSIAIITVVLTLELGEFPLAEAPPQVLTDVLSQVFLLLGALSLGGTLISLKRGRVHRKEKVLFEG
ncbi:MAG: MFS transporter [Methermicoccaceae archaeon]